MLYKACTSLNMQLILRVKRKKRSKWEKDLSFNPRSFNALSFDPVAFNPRSFDHMSVNL